MGQFARDAHLYPELIVSSDAVRARLTATAVAAATGGQLLLDPRLYHASADEILDALQSVLQDDTLKDSAVQRDVATVMIVGHNPGLEVLIAQLTGEQEALPTAALAQLALPIDRWSDLNSSTRGTLVGLWRPKELP